MPQHLTVRCTVRPQNLRTTTRLIQIIQHTGFGAHVETMIVQDTGVCRFPSSRPRTPVRQCIQGTLVTSDSGSVNYAIRSRLCQYEIYEPRALEQTWLDL